DATGRYRLSRLVQNRDFNVSQRLASRAHPRRAFGMVILGRQYDDGAAGFGHAVLLGEAAAKYFHTFGEQIQRNRRGAVENTFQSAEVRSAGARIADDDL